MEQRDVILFLVLALLVVIAIVVRKWKAAKKSSPSTEKVYEFVQHLEEFFHAASHPAELESNEDFKKGVSLLRQPDIDEQEVLRFAIGDNSITSCMALEALCERECTDETHKTILENVGSIGTYAQFFTLKYLTLKTPPETAIAGQVLAKTADYLHVRLCRVSLGAFVRSRHGAGETITFGPEVSKLEDDDLEALTGFLRELEPELGRPLLEDLRRTSSATSGMGELRAAGRIWGQQDVESTHSLVSHETMERGVADVKAILLAERPQSVLLTGERGVGKTTIQRLLARELFEEGWTIFVAGHTDLQAGQSYIGELEERLKKIIAALRSNQKMIWFIPDIERLAYTGKHKYNVESVLDTILPHLESGAIRVVAETAPDAYDRLTQTHSRHLTAFAVMSVPALSKETTLGIAGTWLSTVAEPVDDGLLDDAWDLAEQYHSDLAPPGNLLSLLQSTVLRLAAISEDTKPHLSIEDIIVTLSQQTGLPLDLLDPRRDLDLDDLGAALSERVIGQDEAVQCLVERVAIMKAAVSDPTRPIGVFLFAGPTGTGKTEIAKSLATWLFGSPDRLIRIDMSELQTVQSLDRLLGHPDNQETDALTDQIRKQPFSIVLLDEFEKAHENVWDLFLQVFDDGQLTDRRGRKASFHHAIIILTANLGATIPTGLSIGFGGGPKRFDEQEVHCAVEKSFRREFINRLDRVVVFRPLDKSLMRLILRKELGEVFDRRGLKGRSWAVEWDEPAISFLIEKGFTPDLGARPLKRAVERYLLTPLAETIVRNKIPEGDQFLFVSCQGDALQVVFVDPAADEIDPPEFDDTSEATVEPGGSEPARSVLLHPGGTLSELESLRAQFVALEAEASGGGLVAAKEHLAEKMEDASFWSAPDRFATLGRLEYIDRVENGLRRARSLLGRLEGQKSGGGVPRRLLSMFAQNLYLLKIAISDIVDESPREAFLSVDVPDNAQRDMEEAVAFGHAIADMYEAWAERRNMRLSRIARSDRSDRKTMSALYTVSGYGAHSILWQESGLHVRERPGQGAHQTERDSVRVTVTAQPDAPLPAERRDIVSLAESLRQDDNGTASQIVRRYREKPSPLVRDSVRGWRTGRIDLVFDGNFDLF